METTKGAFQKNSRYRTLREKRRRPSKGDVKGSKGGGGDVKKKITAPFCKEKGQKANKVQSP